MIIVYGVLGWGLMISELMFFLVDIFYEVVDVEGFDQFGLVCECLWQINLLCQVFILRLVDGSIMIEIVVIVLMIFDQCFDLVFVLGMLQC